MDMKQHLVVAAVERPNSEIVVATLKDPQGADLAPWEAGAHIDLHLPSGLIRQYSLCGDPADRTSYRIGVLREAAGRGGSVEAHAILTEGATVAVGGPRNHFRLLDAEGYLFIAGGIGVTPILPMLRTAEACGKPWRLVYGGRSLEAMGFVGELNGWGGRVSIEPHDQTGLLDLEAIFDSLPPGHRLYSCGPEGMMTALEEIAAKRGTPGLLHIERFGAPEGQAEVENSATGYEVELRQSGRTLRVGPGESLRQVLVANGVDVPFSCEEGYCGSCETRVLEGEPIHNDVVLTAEEKAENNLMMVCVGSCKSARLVLDL